MKHTEKHRTHRIGWLRAAVLGANDGIVSTASLIVGVAAAEASRNSVLVAGMAGLVAGAMSMAAGEYVSVSSQADTERADMDRERKELAMDPDGEHAELAAIYVARGLDEKLARQVAVQLTAKDAIGAHARDELGISDTLSARPIPSGLRVGGQFHGRRIFTAGARSPGAATGLGLDGVRQLAPVSRRVGFVGGPGRWFTRGGFSRPGNFLGRVRHGLDCRGGSVVWSDPLSMQLA